MKKSLRETVEIDALDVPMLGTVTRGMRVLHPVFGPGTVVAIFKYGCNAGNAIGVKFDGPEGYKALHPGYAKMKRID